MGLAIKMDTIYLSPTPNNMKWSFCSVMCFEWKSFYVDNILGKLTTNNVNCSFLFVLCFELNKTIGSTQYGNWKCVLWHFY